MRLKRQQEQRGKSGRKYKFVSQLNAQGFIEGALVAPLLSFVTDCSAPDSVPLRMQNSLYALSLPGFANCVLKVPRFCWHQRRCSSTPQASTC